MPAFRRGIPLLGKVLLGAATLAGGTGVIYVVKPSIVFNAVQECQLYQVGLKRKTVTFDDGFTFSYAEKGQSNETGPTLVLLHGFTGDLSATIPVVKHMPQHVHVISVDAPGHGRSSALQDTDFRMSGMAKRLKQFTSKLGLDKEKFHLAGWAMGGTIAGFYAGEYPDDVKLVTIACPGMTCPQNSKPLAEVIAGNNEILLPNSPQALQDLIDMLVEKKITLPQKVLEFIYGNRIKRRTAHTKVVDFLREDVIIGEDNQYVKEISKITSPTQLIWGEKDALIDVSGADLLQRLLGVHCKRKDIVGNCGHSFYMEEPHTLSGLILAFQSDYAVRGKDWETQKTQEQTAA